MSADALAAAIAARTTGGGPGPGRLPREAWEVERAILETRLEIDRQVVEREHPIDGGGFYLRPGQTLGRGKKLCGKCGGVVPSAARSCRYCKAKFKRPSE